MHKRLSASFAMLAVLSVLFMQMSFAEQLTVELVRAKAIAAANLIKAEGKAAFEKIRDPKGEFRFGNGEGYCWIEKTDGTMQMHPLKPTMESKNFSMIKDSNGKYFDVSFQNIIKKYGAGWSMYTWPKAGQTKASPKASYVVSAGGDLFVGSGLYDVTEQDIKAKFPNDFVDTEK